MFLVKNGQVGAVPWPGHDVGRDDDNDATSVVEDEGGGGGGDDGMSE